MKDIMAAMICIIIFAMGFITGTMFSRYETQKTGSEIIRTDRLTGSVQVAIYKKHPDGHRYDNFEPVGETIEASHD